MNKIYARDFSEQFCLDVGNFGIGMKTLIKLKAFEPPKLRNFFASNDGNKEFKDVLHRIPDRF